MNRLSTMKKMTVQIQELIAELECYEPMTGGTGFEDNDPLLPEGVAALTREALHLLEEQREELDDLEEEILDLVHVKSDNVQHEKDRLIEGARKVANCIKSMQLDLRTSQSSYISRTRTSHLRYRDAYFSEVLLPLSAANAIRGTASLLDDDNFELIAKQLSSNKINLPQACSSPSSASLLVRYCQQDRTIRSRSSSNYLESQAVTSSLIRMREAMSSSLERSSFAARIMEESLQSLKRLNEQYDSLDSLLAMSKGILGLLVKNTKTDAWYLQTTVYILLATLAWLLFRRWFYGPLWWLVWLPQQLMWGRYKTMAKNSIDGLDTKNQKVTFDGVEWNAVDEIGGMCNVLTAQVPTACAPHGYRQNVPGS